MLVTPRDYLLHHVVVCVGVWLLVVYFVVNGATLFDVDCGGTKRFLQTIVRYFFSECCSNSTNSCPKLSFI